MPGRVNRAWPIPSYQQFCRVSEYISGQTGLVIPPSKAAWLRDRVQAGMSVVGLKGWQDLLRKLESPGNRRICSRLTDAVSTYETHWFRDEYPFTALARVMIPSWLKQDPQQPVRIWSQGCASGEETWSAAIVLYECAQTYPCPALAEASVLGTDLSPRILAAARLARYEQASLLHGLDGARRARYFDQGADGFCTLLADIRAMARFEPMNILTTLPETGKFHAIFSRNVMMYFGQKQREAVLHKLVSCLLPRGYLVIGSAEYPCGSAAERLQSVELPEGVVFQLR